MKKIIYILVIYFLFILPVFSKNTEKFDVQSNSFMNLGRYIETLEIKEDTQIENKNTNNNDTFEEESIINITKRYENNAVELKLEDVNKEALNSVNEERIFQLKVNETQYRIENDIKTENMIWDKSKAFSQAYFNDTRHLAPIPSVINASTISTSVSQSVKASLGQTNLYDANGPSVLFIRANESTYNTGSVLSYKGDSLNISVGSFSSSYNNAASGGAVISTQNIPLPFNSGSIIIGGACFANEEQDDNKATGGGFLEYTYKRLKLNAQIGQSKYSHSENTDTSLYFIPEFKISDSLYLKTRFIRNITQNNMQDELALTYKPKNSKNNFEFEINATNQYTQNYSIKQRIKLSTSFKI